MHLVNLDPAAEHFNYPVSFDVRNLITLEDVMQELELGPNGGLLYCMEYLEDNLDDWLTEELEAYGEDDYLVFDCPGQIELYNHLNVFISFVNHLRRDGWGCAVVYCQDCSFMVDASKFISGALQALSAMVRLELPHVNVLTKMDICQNKKEVEDFMYPDPRLLLAKLSATTSPKWAHLNQVLTNVLDEFSLVSFVPLDYSDETSIGDVLLQIDMALQYGEDMEPKARDLDPPRDPDDYEDPGDCAVDQDPGDD